MADLAWNRPLSRGSRSRNAVPGTPPSQFGGQELEPCTSTASLFLYSQGSQILCLHHDTLAIERRFQRHRERISFISADNISERGAGRLVVSYDASQTAIVWDLFTGSEIARFASFDPLRIAAWMRNGNVAFGNGKGEIILFEPSTSEHISARTISDPINALAPGSDCRTYAIGYQNGSILIATLHPTFTILHTLSTSRGPSPVAGLAWHTSSSKQKSDMLATQTADGDLRVWSVAKPAGSESPRVIRALKRLEPHSPGPKWIAWSKNGRIVQYSDRATWVWDVRTKYITYEIVTTIDDVRGIGNYGPTATLFTLGPNHTVQQYDLENPTIVANVQHLPPDPLPPPPEPPKLRTISPSHGYRNSDLEGAPDLKDLGDMAAVRRTALEMNAIETVDQQRAEITSPQSARTRTNSISSRASLGHTRQYSPFMKPASTTFSASSPGGQETPQQTATSATHDSMASVSSSRASRPGSRLKNEITYGPADRPLEDLFPFTRSRLSDVSNNHQFRPLDESHLTPDDLRRQMLSVVFCWEGDIEGLIRDELNRHSLNSQNAVFLSRWLGEFNPDQVFLSISSGSVPSFVWMSFALNQMGKQSQSDKLAQVFVQRLLEMGDMHAAATVLLALGDRNDAIEVYVSRNYLMEAVLLTCLLMPSDWQRQSYLVRRWGEHALSNAHHQLAIRCFMCTGIEPSEPWTSPSAQHAATLGNMHAVPPVVASSEIPSVTSSDTSGSQSKPESEERLTVKSSALKVITSFGPQSNSPFKFPGLKSDDHTPTIAPGVTPIAESAAGQSALSPEGLGSYRLNNIRSINNAISVRTATPGGHLRQRLPSIGETPVDVHPPTFPAPKSLPTPVDSGSDKEKGAETSGAGQHSLAQPSRANQGDGPLLLLTSARYDPDNASHTPQTAVQIDPGNPEAGQSLPSPKSAVFNSLKEYSLNRNGSRDRKPEGLQIQLPSVVEQSHLHEIENPMTHHTDLSSQDQADTTDDTRSPTSVLSGLKSTKSPGTRSIDQYISSLDEANYHVKQYRRKHFRSRERRHIDSDRSRNGSRERLRDRSGNRFIPPAKKSPSSPVPMSPEDYPRYNTLSIEGPEDIYRSKPRSGSRVGKPSSQARSSSRGVDQKCRNASKRYSSRGRSSERATFNLASPTSPVPMSATGEDIHSPGHSFEDSLRFVTVDRERLRNKQRSTSRRPERATSAQREQSPDRRRARDRSRSRQPSDRETGSQRQQTEPAIGRQKREVSMERGGRGVLEVLSEDSYKRASTPNSIPVMSAAERLKRELAAAELEARRLSLARRTSDTTFPFPGEPHHTKVPSAGRPYQEGLVDSPPSSGGSFSQRLHTIGKISPNKRSPEFSNTSDSSSPRGRSAVPMGLPATPRAMRYPKYNDGYSDECAPTIPEFPDKIGPMPNTTYQTEAARISRSMSVPVGDLHLPVPNDLPTHPRFNPDIPSSRSMSKPRTPVHHQSSGSHDLISARSLGFSPPVAVSIEELATNTSQNIQVTTAEVPPILPELQHLTAPPPPPPVPMPGLGQVLAHDPETTNFSMENGPLEKETILGLTLPDGRENHRPPADHRRARSINESFATKIRNLTGRMRSTSRGPGGRSPPVEFLADKMSPYESIQLVTADNRI